MNFVFISPNFPVSYWLFCQGLKNNGVNVLAISDAPYEELSSELKNVIQEYYKVSNMENYDEMLRAVAFFTFKYGKIDWIESNNEYWLRQDAKLRKDFNVTNGFCYEHMDEYQCKSKMKEAFRRANVATARYRIATTLEDAIEFTQEVGFPIVIKPDIGVGANDTHKINNLQELKQCFMTPFETTMIMEEFVKGTCFSFDGLTNSNCELLFTTSHCYLDSLMDVVNEQKESGCYSLIDIPKEIMEIGERTVKAFKTKSRFFHFEFFRLSEDQAIGKKGDIVGLEVNMRPPGGFLPDMINYACNCNVYQLWADMICYDQIKQKQIRSYSSGFIGRRDHHVYQYSIAELKVKYSDSIIMIQRLPQVLSTAMGDEVIIARFEKEDKMLEFMHDAVR